MKVFISADIEGIASTTLWDETHPLTQMSITAPHLAQMTREVKAACEGAIAAGATEIVIKDGHGSATNIDANQLPACAKLIRGWTGHPYSMAYGVDSTFDAAMFIGYHSAAGRCGNPLSHTFTGKTNKVRLNGMVCSEFLLYSWVCAREGVPTVLLSGDQMLCDDSKEIHPNLTTVAVKEGFGGSTCAINPNLACEKIREAAEKALAPGFSKEVPTLPEHFVLELTYKEHKDAVRASFYPGCVQTDDCTVRFETDDYFELLRSVKFIF